MIVTVDQAAAILGKSVSELNSWRQNHGRDVLNGKRKAPVTKLFEGIKTNFSHINWKSKTYKDNKAITRRLTAFLADQNCFEVTVFDDLPRTRPRHNESASSSLNDSHMSIDVDFEEQFVEQENTATLSDLFRKFNVRGAKFSYSTRLNLLFA